MTTISVTPGSAATQLSGAKLPAGTSIYNTDPVNGVWIASTPSVAPGRGQYVGPLGQAQWRSESQAWARVDAGVSAIVVVSISTDVSQIDNPLAIAEATAAQIAASGLAASVGVQVATQLLLNGVPNVLVQNTLVNLPGIFTLAPATSLVLDSTNGLSIGKYASLLVQLNTANPTAVIAVDYDLNATFNTLNYLYREFYSIYGNGDPGTWLIPVNCQSCRITNSGPTSTNLVVSGTNRPIAQPMQLGRNNMPRRLNYAGATAVGTTVYFSTNDADPSSQTRFNRSITLRAASASIAGNIGYEYIKQDGTSTQIVLTNVTAGGQTFLTVAHPGVPCKWFITPTGASAATTFTLDIGWQGP